jgi:surface protein
MSPIPSTAELYAFLGEIMYYEEAIYYMIEDLVRFKPKNKHELKYAIGRWKDKIYHEYAILRYGPIEIWNTILITDMSNLFGSSNDWTVPYWEFSKLNITGWDVSNVTNMEGMFKNSYYELDTHFENWDVGNVTNMSFMFYNQRRYNFNPILNGWDVSCVTDMSFMFFGCPCFNQSLDSWDVSQVKAMDSMFELCIEFDGDICSWDVGNVKCMSHTFDSCNRFNQPIGNWDVGSVEEMSFMFSDCSVFDQSLVKWVVGRDTNLLHIFDGCNQLNSVNNFPR